MPLLVFVTHIQWNFIEPVTCRTCASFIFTLNPRPHNPNFRIVPSPPHHSDDRSHRTYSRTLPYPTVQGAHVQSLVESGTASCFPRSTQCRIFYHISLAIGLHKISSAIAMHSQSDYANPLYPPYILFNCSLHLTTMLHLCTDLPHPARRGAS